MMKNYIALFFGATLLYGCGGSNSGMEFQEEQPTNSTSIGFETLQAGQESNYIPSQWAIGAPDTDIKDAYYLFQDDASYSFMYTWMTNGDLAPVVKFEDGERVAIAISERHKNYEIDFLSFCHDGINTTIEVKDIEPETSYAMNVFPYAIAQFDSLTGDPSDTFIDRYTLSQNGELTENEYVEVFTFTRQPTYEELINEDVQRRVSGQNYFPDFSGDTDKVLEGKCPHRHVATLVEADVTVLWSTGHDPTRAGFCPLDGTYYLWDPLNDAVKGPFVPGQDVEMSEKQ